MRCLVTGSSGLLGSYLLKTANPSDFIYSKRFDILDKSATYKAFDEAKPEVVIHCAGEGRVDFAETNRCEAWQTTYEGCQMVLKASEYWGATFVQISSNAVYAGDAPPYNENSYRFPVNTYGRYKAECDNLVGDSRTSTMIIRPIMMYGWPSYGRRDNFVTRLIKSLRTEGLKSFCQIPVDNEIISQPTYAYDCAVAIWKALKTHPVLKREFNIAAAEKTTLYSFALQVAKVFDLDPGSLTPVKSSQIPVVAKRPVDTTFSLKKIHGEGIFLRNQEEGLKAMKAEIE